ncbi:MAG: M1 family metallopeptidase [Longimonas sp.]|uniref:M1 family metallopeptidase n=1 Tax=Longimonas sp. TaxID=2039626 RepID=UPI00334B7FD9
MPLFRSAVLLLCAALLLVPTIQAQSPESSSDPRPVPYSVTPPSAFMDAVAANTRTLTGAPGSQYWTNTTTYDIDATLDPETAELTGSATIRYANNAPEPLLELKLHLRQNLHAEGAIRNREVQVTGGITVERVALYDTDTDAFDEEPRYEIDGTVMTLPLDTPLASGDTAHVEVDWSFEVPRGSEAPRMGREGSAVFYLGYWYPQMAVYDDVDGWVAERYQGNGEFYMGFADYTVNLTVPEGWLVAATGMLQNEDAVLTEPVQERIHATEAPDAIQTIVGPDERGAGSATRTSESGTLTWTFHAENVRDFAWGTSADYIWDATTATTSDGPVRINTLYRPGTAAWERSAEYARFSIEHLSDMLLPYPYPHMTAVEGVIGGGMEYPMITVIGGDRTPQSLFRVTYHEISHMWFPMLVSTNEKRYTWMDEGTTSFNTNEGTVDFYNANAWAPNRQYYYGFAGHPDETPSMRHNDRFPIDGPARVVASYNKPGVMLHALRGILGEETFFEAYRTYAEQWMYKHPTPHDLFHTFETVSGEDLSWFWRGTLYETWTMDHSIDSVAVEDERVTVTVHDSGNLPMPIILEVTYDDGTTEMHRREATDWIDTRTRRLQVSWDTPADATVTRIQLDPGRFLPDVDRRTHLWMPTPGE